jgi:hypothetical protein
MSMSAFENFARATAMTHSRHLRHGSHSAAVRPWRSRADNRTPLADFAAADMPGADDLMMRVYAAMAQKERELISERTRAALGAAKARGAPPLAVTGATGPWLALTAGQHR